MKPRRTMVLLAPCLVLPLWILGCGESGPDEFEEACEFACEGFGECDGLITTTYPIYFDFDTCADEFCSAGDTLVDPPGRGTQVCDDALLDYLDCLGAMSCPSWDSSSVVSAFTGSGAEGCDAEADDFVLACLAMIPF